MKLSGVLVACNENTHYLDFWPVVKEAWWKIAGLPCVMVYVGETLPSYLQNDPAVRFFKAIPDWPTATQAQIIRLLYPALLGSSGAIMLSDMDMIPMQKDFFVEGFKQFPDDLFVSLRGIDEGEQQIYMCYVGATPTVWSKMFQIKTEDDIRARLISYSEQYPSNGRHGGLGWCSDQMELYRVVKAAEPTKIGIVPWTPQIPRIDRLEQADYDAQKHVINDALRGGIVVDYHMPPFKGNEAVIQSLIEVRCRETR